MKIRNRDKCIKILRKLGVTYKNIGRLFGISRQRAQQIYINPLSKKRKLNPFAQKVKDFGGRERTREMVRIRDKYTCQDCGKKWDGVNRRFDVHHLNGLCGKKSRAYDKVKDMGGLITLCHRCHFNRPEHKAKQRRNLTKPLSTGVVYEDLQSII